MTATAIRSMIHSVRSSFTPMRRLQIIGHGVIRKDYLTRCEQSMNDLENLTADMGHTPWNPQCTLIAEKTEALAQHVIQDPTISALSYFATSLEQLQTAMEAEIERYE